MRDLAGPTGNGRHAPNERTIEATYDYQDERGELLYQSVRYTPKDFNLRRPKPGGGWEGTIGGTRRVPYRLPELISADQDEWVLLPEGEKDVDRLRGLGLIATCNVGGADKWLPEYNQHLRGRRVVVLPDNDQPGRKHAEQVAAGLRGVAAEVKVIELPGLPNKGDVSDWLNAGGTVEDLRRLVDQAPSWTPAAVSSAETIDEQVVDVPLPEPVPWPIMDDDAYHGLAGEIVRLIEPETEADPVAILGQLLVGFGNMIGRAAHYVVEGTTHHANLFAGIVGNTARGRKGTSEGRVKQVLRFVDEAWVLNNIVTGLVSGEVLTWAVRDQITKREPIYEGKGKDKRIVGYNEVVADEGVDDKRLLVVESEFAAVLRAFRREQNTLSPTLRSAWDTGHLRTLAKNSPAKATGAHVSIIGHITQEELRRALAEVELFNGFANRFLWFAVKRSRLLPDGGRDLDLTRYAQRLARAAEQARSVGRMHRDSGAAALWRQVYGELADDQTGGLLGAVTSRAEAQVLRLSMIYALLDGSGLITEQHLRAALAVWRYCRSSARLIFGSASGDPVAEQVLRAIRQAPGIGRRDLHRALGNHVKATVLVATLARLRDAGRVRVEKVETGGRPAEHWFVCEQSEQSEQPPAGSTRPGPKPEESSLSSLSSQEQTANSGMEVTEP